MRLQNTRHRWYAVGNSVRGASHIRSGAENQDDFMILPQEGIGEYVVATLSDGHGDAKCFRSKTGSRFAVETATSELIKFIEGPLQNEHISVISREAQESLVSRIHKEWQNKISEDQEKNKFTDEEISRLEKSKGAAAVKAVNSNPFLAYGATLSAVLVSQEYIVYLQIGDGEIIMVPEDGPPERPIPVDERLFGNETTSLSGKNAVGDFRVYFQSIYGPAPALIFLCSDGYSNAYQTDESLFQAGTDILGLVKSKGIEVLETNLNSWLKDTTEKFTGDDTTLVVLVREDLANIKDSDKPEDATDEHKETGSSSPSPAMEHNASDDETASKNVAPEKVDDDEGAVEKGNQAGKPTEGEKTDNTNATEDKDKAIETEVSNKVIEVGVTEEAIDSDKADKGNETNGDKTTDSNPVSKKGWFKSFLGTVYA